MTWGNTTNPQYAGETLGGRDKDIDVHCVCGDKQQGDRCQMRCAATVRHSIVLNRNLALANPGGAMGHGLNGRYSRQRLLVPWDQVMGHEQRHVVSTRGLVQVVVDTENSNAFRRGYFNTPKSCGDAIPENESRIKDLIKSVFVGPNHLANNGDRMSNTNGDAPIAEVGYKPLPGSPPLPANPGQSTLP